MTSLYVCAQSNCTVPTRSHVALAPTYLTDLCEQCSNINLRSASRGDYILPRSRLRCVDSSFSISAPTAWNNLPAHIRSCTSLSQFLSKLKSHLFIRPTSFPPQYHPIESTYPVPVRLFPFYFSFYFIYAYLCLMSLCLAPQSSGGEAR